MIPVDFISEWRKNAPWVSDHQVEQDLIIGRVLVEIFSDKNLSGKLAFRGGTALSKLYMPAARYSEDIDLVQINSESIGPVFNGIRKLLDAWLGEPEWNNKKDSANLIYHFESEVPPIKKLRLKIEINTREHFSIYGFIEKEYHINSRWFKGGAGITTYSLEELLGTKLRALYQRRKGRDLFDLWKALSTQSDINTERIVEAFKEYMKRGGFKISKKVYQKNLDSKMKHAEFINDIKPLISHETEYDNLAAFNLVTEKLIEKIQG